MVKACLQSEKTGQDYLFKFNDDSIYHMKSGSLAGLPIRGWAIPPILPNFKLAYYVQLLHRYDGPMRWTSSYLSAFCSRPTPPPADRTRCRLSTWARLFRTWRTWSPRRGRTSRTCRSLRSASATRCSAASKALAPKDNIALALDELLNSMGFPAELYKGTLSIQAFPVALRLFEKQWNGLVDGYNEFINWLLDKISRHFMWGEVEGSLRSVTLADDIERKALSLQAAAGQDISKSTAYRPLGIDYMEEQKRVMEEQLEIARLQQQAMEEQQAQQAQPSGGGGGGGGAPAAGATPGDVHEQAKALAQQLLIQTPETMRRGELIKIKHSNPTLHALVIQEMDNMRQEMARQGQAQMLEQAKQASAGAGDSDIPGYGPANALPSPVRVGLLIADQLTEYTPDDLMKIAMDIKNDVPHAGEAFRYVFRRINGWE